MSNFVEGFFDKCNDTQWKKNRDYHPDNVAMLEILQTAFETNITVEQDLWARIRKQMSALRRFIIEGHVESEPPEARMGDVAVYMGILAYWTQHRYQCVMDAIVFITDHRRCEIYNVHSVSCLSRASVVHMCDRCNFLSWLNDYADTLKR